MGLWVRVRSIPQPRLYAGILVFATIGTCGVSQSPIDLLLLDAIGAVGFPMRLYDVATAPVIIGMILGPLAEQELRRALTISQGDPSALLTRPLSASLLALALRALLAPLLWRRLARRNLAGG